MKPLIITQDAQSKCNVEALFALYDEMTNKKQAVRGVGIKIQACGILHSDSITKLGIIPSSLPQE